jgi:hypothetical protein
VRGYWTNLKIIPECGHRKWSSTMPWVGTSGERASFTRGRQSSHRSGCVP